MATMRSVKTLLLLFLGFLSVGVVTGSDCPASCESQPIGEQCSSMECSSCAICQCLPWCFENVQPWETQCNWSACAGCIQCKRCEGWCSTHIQPWENKCNWSACAGCFECKKCEGWCSSHIQPWEKKCNWETCGGCSECKKCEGWCSSHIQPWEKKCNWESCGGCSECPVAQEKKPNILIIFADDVGTGDIPGYWDNQDVVDNMPNISEMMVKKGTLFTDTHSTPLCAPSRYVILSGNYAHRGRLPTGTWKMGQPKQFIDGQQSIAQVLRDQGGYHTAIMGKWHIGGKIPSSHQDGPSNPFTTTDILTNERNDWDLPLVQGPQTLGFDSSFISDKGIQGIPYSFFRDGYLNHTLDDVRYWEVGSYDMPLGKSTILKEGDGDVDWDSTAYNMILVNETNRFLDDHMENRPDDPFFAHVALGAAHIPHTPPDYYMDGTKVAGETPTPFLDMMKELDLVVGSLVKSIEDRGLAEDTIIILTSDNGGLKNQDSQDVGHYSSGPLRAAKGTIYEGGHRVPFIIRHDGVFPASARRDHLIGINDIFATLCEIAGVDVPSGSAVDSISFADYIVSNNTAGLREFLGTWAYLGSSPIGSAIRYNNYKLVVDHRKNDTLELYDLSVDIGETTDLAKDAHQDVMDLIAMMKVELEAIGP